MCVASEPLMTLIKVQPAMASPRPSVKSEIHLAAVATAASCSRLFVRSTLKSWHLDHLADDAELLVSELVTNAVTMTGITEPSPSWPMLADLALIQVRLVVLGDGLVIEVWDQNSTLPIARDEEDLDAEGGRGLLIVKALSRRWGFYRAEGGGKWVWCELEIPLKPGPLPKRQRTWKPSPAQVNEYAVEPDLLRRVRDGLKAL